jgi:4-amino-4-deoxy-L-arabinose transferase-like glycosyltransferase
MLLVGLLPLYTLIILGLQNRQLVGDEKRYASYAERILHGRYMDPATQRLWSGPGYPLVLAPVAAAGIPIRGARLLNGVFLYVAALLVYGCVRQFASRRAALNAALVLGLYPSFVPELVALLTEPLSVMLVSGFLYAAMRALRTHSPGWTLAAGLFLGYLALTKVIYAYVLLAGGALALVLAARSAGARRLLAVAVIALVTNVPYLAYTWAMTGKTLFWANSGGLSLYWMATPYADEYGDWTSPGDVLKGTGFEEHRDLFRRMENMDYMQRDRELTRAALDNIREHPATFVFNWAMNMSRMWFCYPNSHKVQRPHTVGYLVVNGALLSALLASAYPLWVARRRLPPEIRFVLAFAAVAFVLNSLLSAVPRMLNPIVPAFFVIIAYAVTRLVEIRLRGAGETNEEPPWRYTN